MENKNINCYKTFDLFNKLKNEINLDESSVIMFLDEIQDTPEEYIDNNHFFFVHMDDIRSMDDVRDISSFNKTIDELCEFIVESFNKRKFIYVSCDYGISRSAACVAAIKEMYFKNGLSIFSDDKYKPNKILFRNILNRLKEMKNSQNSSGTTDDVLLRIINMINKYDPEGILNIGAPLDEYSLEARTIQEIIEKDKLITPETVYDVFNEMFERTSMTFKQAIQIADDLKHQLNLEDYD